jgi:hypothetical protein
VWRNVKSVISYERCDSHQPQAIQHFLHKPENRCY